MDNSPYQRLQEALERSQSITVAIGRNPSVDQTGAALALYLSLREMGKNVSVLSASEPIVELSNLVGVDKIKTRYEAEGSDLVVSFPYREGEIEKVSYTIENGYLNIVVKAGEQGLSFAEQDVKYTHGSGGQLDLLIVVGIERLSDINAIFSPDVLKNVTIVNIDNKQENQGYGDIVLVSNRFSSVSEQATQIMSELRTPIDRDIAQNLLDGIMFATENFQSPRTSFLAFEMAGILMRQGAVRSGTQPQPAFRQRQDFTNQSMPQRRPQMPQERPERQQDRRQQFDQRSRQQPRQQQQNYQQNRQPQQRQQAQQPQQQQQQQSQQPRQPRMQQNQPEPQSQPQPQPRPQPQPQPQPIDDANAPTDWLTPKVYKGSSNVE